MIRRTSPEDHEGIVQLAIASGLFDADQTDLLVDMLHNPEEDHIWITDWEKSQVVGSAFVAPEKMTYGTWNLYWIAVHPSRQQQGRGTAILRYIESMLRDCGERILLVETEGTSEFDYVREFYRKNGFEAEARIRDFYNACVDKVVFRKQLAVKPI